MIPRSSIPAFMAALQGINPQLLAGQRRAPLPAMGATGSPGPVLADAGYYPPAGPMREGGMLAPMPGDGRLARPPLRSRAPLPAMKPRDPQDPFASAQAPTFDLLRAMPGAPQVDEAGDIGAALAANEAMGDKGHKGLFPGKDWKVIAGIIGDAMMAYGGMQPTFGPGLARRREAEAQQEFDREKWAAQQAAESADRLRPKFEQIGNTGGLWNPATNSYEPIYTAPQPFEIYARQFGEPGSDEYFKALEDYRAGTWNDQGVAGRLTVQGPRLEQSNTNNIRSTSTSRDNNIRSTGTSRGNSIRSTGQSNANSLRTTNQSNVNSERTDRRVRDSAGFRGRGGRGGAATAVGPNGQRIVVRNGRWVDAQTGRPVQ